MKIRYIVIGFVVILLSLAGYIFYSKKYQSWFSKLTDTNTEATSTLPFGIESTGDATFETIPLTETIDTSTTPDLTRDFVDLSITGSQRTELKNKLAEISTILKEDPNDYFGWLDLASYRKVSLDYSGAIEIWEFMTDAWPDDTVAYMNLANYYHYILHESVQAESYYRKAIQKNTTRIDGYTELHNLYKDVYSAKKGQADDILIEGLTKNPNDVTLLYTLAQYYAESGDKSNAKKRYDELEIIAKTTNNTNLLERIARDRTDYNL